MRGTTILSVFIRRCRDRKHGNAVEVELAPAASKPFSGTKKFFKIPPCKVKGKYGMIRVS